MPSLQQSLFMEFLTQDSMEEQLFQWVDEPVLPMCCFASGLLAFALLDDHCADEAVRRGLVPKLLRRLRGIVFEDQTVIGAPGAKEQGGGDQELTGKDLLRRERGYVLQCLCVLMSYKECLACALQVMIPTLISLSLVFCGRAGRLINEAEPRVSSFTGYCHQSTISHKP